MMNMGPNRFAPVRVGEEIDVKIEAVGEKGDGIAKKNGFVLFVPNTKAGDEVRIRISRVMKKVGFADVVGKAQGPINTEPVHQMPKPRREEPREEIQIDESKDSEDFGEDDSDDQHDDSSDEDDR